MKRRIARWMPAVGIICALMALAACEFSIVDGPSRSAELMFRAIGESDAIGGPDDPLTVPLIAGQTIDIGAVDVWIEGNTLNVRYATEWSLSETQLHVAADPSGFPRTRKGNPKPGHFDFKMTHEPGTSTYTYVVDYPGLLPGDVLYFAAHAEVELWIDDVLVAREGAWADGYEFPGKNWATYFAGEIPEPVAVTGNWEAYLEIPDLDAQVGPIPFSMLQTGTEVDASDGFVGSVEGLLLTLSGYIAELPVELIGTISQSGDVIEGAITGELNGTFRFEQPTELPYGHFDLQATVDGVSAELGSEWALADFHGDDYDWTFEVGYGDPHSNTLVLIKFEGPLYEVPLETEVPATILLWRDADGEDSYAAWTDIGAVILTGLTESSIAGEFLISEPDAQVSGSFDVGFWDNPF